MLGGGLLASAAIRDRIAPSTEPYFSLWNLMKRYVPMSFLILVATIAVSAIVGCGPRIETYDIPPRTAVTEARDLFEGYAAGNPATSEIENYPALIEKVRTEDAEAAKVIVPALEKIKANPASAKATATQALKDLPPAPAAPATP
jgi:hypothetical protein